MCRRQQLARRFLAQHVVAIGRVQVIGRVGLPALELADDERAAKLRQMIAEIAGERGFVEPVPVADGRGVGRVPPLPMPRESYRNRIDDAGERRYSDPPMRLLEAGS